MANRGVAFVHVDVDNLWALGECYGIELPAGSESLIYEDALPRLKSLLGKLGISSTLFIVGRDLEQEANVEVLRALKAEGHRFSNHSYSHALNFRDLSREEIESEVGRTEELIKDKLGEAPWGFRAPGYGASPALLEVLARRGYAYDSSIMPGPYGFVFRFLDARLRRSCAKGQTANMQKTQYSRLSEARAPLSPYRVSLKSPVRVDAASPLVELPAATSPFLRLPFQAGVCMRLGESYFRFQLGAFRRQPKLPLLFLLHGADVADFSKVAHPFFQNSPFFSTPVEEKLRLLESFLTQIQASHEVVSFEGWLESGKA